MEDVRRGVGERYGAEKLTELCKLLPDNDEVLNTLTRLSFHASLCFILKTIRHDAACLKSSVSSA